MYCLFCHVLPVSQVAHQPAAMLPGAIDHDFDFHDPVARNHWNKTTELVLSAPTDAIPIKATGKVFLEPLRDRPQVKRNSLMTASSPSPSPRAVGNNIRWLHEDSNTPRSGRGSPKGGDGAAGKVRSPLFKSPLSPSKKEAAEFDGPGVAPVVQDWVPPHTDEVKMRTKSEHAVALTSTTTVLQMVRTCVSSCRVPGHVLEVKLTGIVVFYSCPSCPAVDRIHFHCLGWIPPVVSGWRLRVR
jgi:hypothetical protein